MSNLNDSELANADDEIIVNELGLRIERHGRFIYMENSRTPEEQEALMERLLNVKNTLPESIRQKAIELESTLSKYNSFDIVANLCFANLLIDPDIYKEYLHEGRSAYVEYVALLCLKHPYSEGEDKLRVIDGVVAQVIQDKVKEIFTDTMWLTIARSVNGGQTEDFTEIQYAIRSYELAVRNPAYLGHLQFIVEGLFDPFKDTLLQTIGFTASDAIKLSDAIAQLMPSKLVVKVEQAKKQGVDLINMVRDYKKGLPVDFNSDNERKIVEDLARLKYKERVKRIENMSMAYAFAALGDVCSFTIQELASFTKIAEERVRNFVDAFSLKFGDVEADFFIPSPTHQLRERPLIVNGNQYLSPSPSLLDWAIQPMLENVLKNAAGNVWNRYANHRHEFLLRTSTELLKKAMPDLSLEMNLHYPMTSQSQAMDAELDALGVYDSVLFLVEAKGASLTDPAKRGAPDRLRRHLNELIGEAHEQAIRAKAYIDSNNLPEFERSDGTIFNLNKRDLMETFLVSLTLEPIGHLTALIHAENDLDVLRKGEFPWMVSVYDLLVIADLIEYPSMLPHYIKRRIRCAKQGLLKAIDELDVFGYYLKEGLYFHSEDDIRPAHQINLMSYTTDFDDYYLYKSGMRSKTAPKPRQQLPLNFRTLLHAIENSKAPGRVSIAMTLLDLNDETRRGFAKMIQVVKKKHKDNKIMHDASIGGANEDGWGITYMIASTAQEIDKKLLTYCTLKKYQQKAKLWIGMGDLAEKKYAFCEMLYLEHPWEEDQKLDELVKQYFE